MTRRAFSVKRSNITPLLWSGSAHDLGEAGRVDVLGEGGAHFVGSHAEIAHGGFERLIERQPDSGAADQTASEGVFTRFAERDLAQQERLGLLELGGRHVIFLHSPEFPLYHYPRFRDVFRIAAVADRIGRAGFA